MQTIQTHSCPVVHMQYSLQCAQYKCLCFRFLDPREREGRGRSLRRLCSGTACRPFVDYDTLERAIGLWVYRGLICLPDASLPESSLWLRPPRWLALTLHAVGAKPWLKSSSTGLKSTQRCKPSSKRFTESLRVLCSILPMHQVKGE